MSVKISLTTLKKQVEDGMKKSQLAEHYGMSELQVGKLLKQAGLRIRKFHKPAFELVNDEEIAKVTEVEFETQPVDAVIEDSPREVPVEEGFEGFVKDDAKSEDLFSDSPTDKEEMIIFEDSSVEKVEIFEDDEDPLLNELIK